MRGGDHRLRWGRRGEGTDESERRQCGKEGTRRVLHREGVERGGEREGRRHGRGEKEKERRKIKSNRSFSPFLIYSLKFSSQTPNRQTYATAAPHVARRRSVSSRMVEVEERSGQAVPSLTVVPAFSFLSQGRSERALSLQQERTLAKRASYACLLTAAVSQLFSQ